MKQVTIREFDSYLEEHNLVAKNDNGGGKIAFDTSNSKIGARVLEHWDMTGKNVWYEFYIKEVI